MSRITKHDNRRKVLEYCYQSVMTGVFNHLCAPLRLRCCRLNEAVTPLLSTPYPEQLRMKEKAMSDFLKKMAKKILHKESNPVSS